MAPCRLRELSILDIRCANVHDTCILLERTITLAKDNRNITDCIMCSLWKAHITITTMPFWKLKCYKLIFIENNLGYLQVILKINFWCHFKSLKTSSDLQWLITQKMADQGWSDLHVVFTMTLCGTNFSIWQDMELIFTGYLQIASQILFT